MGFIGMHHPSVNIARLVYLLICQAGGVAIALSTKNTSIEISITDGFLVGFAIGLIFIGIDKLMEGFTLRGFSTATFGLGVGLFCAWLLTRVELSALLELAFRNRIENSEDGQTMIDSLRLALDVTLFASLGFLGTVLALRGNREDFAFIIPYVRFREDARSGQPIVIDSEAIMDGRILGLINSGFIGGRLIVPNYVLEEIQTLANEATSNLRQRAQRGLDHLETMQKSPQIQISIHDARSSETLPNQHARLIETAKFLGAHLLTLDESLSKIAKLQGVVVLNLNELNLALRPMVAIGEPMQIALVRPGKEDHQAIGYLSDGTMVVVNESTDRIGTTAQVVVTSTLQTASGMMVFAELKDH